LDQRGTSKILPSHHAAQNIHEERRGCRLFSPIHRQVTHSDIAYFRELKEEDLVVSKLRCDASPKEVKNREPFGFKNFFAATFRVERYTRIIQYEGLAYWVQI
jgi:hypothetical protein